MSRTLARMARFCALALLIGSPALADWSGFYASPTTGTATGAAARPAATAPSQRCQDLVPALSAVPALGEAPAAGSGCVPSATAPRSAPLEASGDPLLAPDGACVSAILNAQSRYAIPGDLLLGIGLQEAGIERGQGLTVWPWSVNVEGEGRFLSGPGEAISWVRQRRAEGAELIDVGCMQINLRWHPDAFASLEEAFDPVRNVDYAARYLVSLQERTGDWRAAAGWYHSADPERAARYLSGVETNLRVLSDRVGPAGSAEAPFEGDLDALLNALVADAPEAGPRPLWSAGLGAPREDGTAVYGLYGRGGLSPVLPNFTRNF